MRKPERWWLLNSLQLNSLIRKALQVSRSRGLFVTTQVCIKELHRGNAGAAHPGSWNCTLIKPCESEQKYSLDGSSNSCEDITFLFDSR